MQGDRFKAREGERAGVSGRVKNTLAVLHHAIMKLFARDQPGEVGAVHQVLLHCGRRRRVLRTGIAGGALLRQGAGDRLPEI